MGEQARGHFFSVCCVLSVVLVGLLVLSITEVYLYSILRSFVPLVMIPMCSRAAMEGNLLLMCRLAVRQACNAYILLHV